MTSGEKIQAAKAIARVLKEMGVSTTNGLGWLTYYSPYSPARVTVVTAVPVGASFSRLPNEITIVRY